MATKIRKGQIKTEDFIIPSSGNPTWATETETASQKAIADKILSLIAGVAGAMLYQGAWSSVPANGVGVKKGYVYVYNGSGTAPTGTTLDNGDTLIANTDTPDPTNSTNWTIIQSNIEGALTLANFGTNVLAGSNITITYNSSTKKYTIAASATYPTIANGSVVTGKYVAGFSITNGVITLVFGDLPNFSSSNFHTETLAGTLNGTNDSFTIPSGVPLFIIGVFVNGLKQKLTDDYTITGNTIKFTASAYIPQTGDILEIVYIK